MYQFDPFILDPVSVHLTKNGEELVVEPQVFDTLLYLIKHRDRVVSKDELLDEIWQGKVVTESSITRTIYELRKLLDSDSAEKSCIRTVRGKGYQFIVQVTETLTEKGADNISADKKPNAVQNKMLFVLLALLMVVSFVLINQKHILANDVSLPVAAPVSEKNKSSYSVVAVLPILVDKDNDQLSMLVQSLLDYLIYQLESNLNMKVIHPDSLLHMSEQLDDVWAIQKATRADFLIKGFIEPKADTKVKLHLSLYKNNADGELTPVSLGAFDFQYPKNIQELNDLYRQRKVTVRSITEIIKPGMVTKGSGDFETDDPEAYRLVIAAHHISRSDDCQGMQRAEALLLKAIERDDEFVYAYLQLFSNYYRRVWICGESIENHEKGLAMASKIDELAPDTYQVVKMRKNTILVESNQVEAAFEQSKNVNWNDPKAIYDQTYMLRYAGFLNLASSNIDRILHLDPYFFNDKPVQHAPNTLLYQNKFAEHLAQLAEPGSSYHDYYRGLNLYITGNTDQAAIILQGVVSRTPNDLFGKFSLALLYVIEGENLKAIEVIDAIVKLRTDNQHTDGEMTYKVAQLYALAGADDLALSFLDTTVNQGFFPMNYFLHDPALKSIQGKEKFLSTVQKATERHDAFAHRFGLTSETIR